MERLTKGARNRCTATLPWRQEENFLGIREDFTELAASQKVTELPETKPGSKYPPNTTQGERGETVYKLFSLFLSWQRGKTSLDL